MNRYELYVLCQKRSKELVLNFLDSFLPNRKEVADEYPYPELSDNPSQIFHDVNTLLTVLEVEKTATYSLYWNSSITQQPYMGMVFYTSDHAMILGLVVEEKTLRQWLGRLQRFVNGSYGYVTFEGEPPYTQKEFIKICKNSRGFRLIEGKIFD